MVIDGVAIGISDCLSECLCFFLGLRRVIGSPGLEHPLGAVQKVLLPGHCNDLDAPAGLAELVPKLPMGGPLGIKLSWGGHAWVDVDKDRPVLLDGQRHLDGGIPGAAVGAAGIDPFR